MDFLQQKIEILVLFGSAARAVVARSGPNLVVTLGNDPSTIPQSLVPVAQTITCGARITQSFFRVPQLICTPLCEKDAKNRCSHNFLNIHPKLDCDISFFLSIPALAIAEDYRKIRRPWQEIQKTPIFSTVVCKLIGALRILNGYCFPFLLITQLSEEVTLKSQCLLLPQTQTSLTVFVSRSKLRSKNFGLTIFPKLSCFMTAFWSCLATLLKR